MSREDLDTRILELLYEELPPEREAALRAQIEGDAELSARLRDWQGVRRVVADLPELEPDPQVHYDLLRAARAAVAEPESKGFFAWLESLLLSPALAGAAVLILGIGGTWLLLEGGTDSGPAPAMSPPATSAPKAEAPEALAETTAQKDPSVPKKAKAAPALNRKLEPAKEKAAEATKPAAAAPLGAALGGATREAERAEAKAKTKSSLPGASDGWTGSEGKTAKRRAKRKPKRRSRRPAARYKKSAAVSDPFADPPPASKPQAAPRPAPKPVAAKLDQAEDHDEFDAADKGAAAAPAAANAPETQGRFAPPPPPPQQAPAAPQPEPEPVTTESLVAGAEGGDDALADDLAPPSPVPTDHRGKRPPQELRPSPPPAADAEERSYRGERRSAQSGPPAVLKAARAARRGGNLRDAAQRYEAFMRDNRGHAEFAGALLEAAQTYEKLEDHSRARQLYKLLQGYGGRYAAEAQKGLQRISRLRSAPPREAPARSRRPKKKNKKKAADLKDAFESNVEE